MSRPMKLSIKCPGKNIRRSNNQVDISEVMNVLHNCAFFTIQEKVYFKVYSVHGCHPTDLQTSIL